jgi:hypothetical protein
LLPKPIFIRLWRGSEAISPKADKSQMLITGNNRRRMVKVALVMRTDYQVIPDKNRPTPDNIGIGGALGGFLLTNQPIIFSMTVLKTITTNA